MLKHPFERRVLFVDVRTLQTSSVRVKEQGHSMPVRYRAPWGTDKANQSTVVTQRDTIESAFAEIDRMAAQMLKTGCPSDTVELIVVDEAGCIVRRPHAS